MAKINIKDETEIAIMREGGRKLRKIKNALKDAVKSGVSAADIEELAEELIKKSGGEASFKKVQGYKWCTCVNVNDGVVHGIPHKTIIFKKGDLVSVDVGLFYKGFHTDTSVTVEVDTNKESSFIGVGKAALAAGIKKAKPGGRVYDISEAIEKELVKADLNPIWALVGHGVGRELHEDPHIPCYTRGNRKNSPEIPKGAVFAIEVMYTSGSGEVYLDSSDKWTILTRDGKIASLFEETVAVLPGGPLVLT